MLIDWFTVGAQVLNFLVLIWLMKRFLYGPILKAIEVREQRIATQLADAETKMTEAGKQRDELQHKNELFDQSREALLGKAVAEAKTEGERMIGDARKAADALSFKRAQALADESRQLNQAVKQSAQIEVFAIARKTLGDLADTALEQRITEVFIARLHALDDPAKATLATAITTSKAPAVVRSVFALPEAQREAVQSAINDKFSSKVALQYETAPDLIGGIELSAKGQNLSWSISGYLAALEKSVAELLQEKAPPASPQTVDETAAKDDAAVSTAVSI